MSIYIDMELSPEQQAAMQSVPESAWFTQVRFRNYQSPCHPELALEQNNQAKQDLIGAWVRSNVAGKRVLDLFSANGAFSLLAAQAGASEVVGVEYDKERVACAQLLADFVSGHYTTRLNFRCGDVYKLDQLLDEPFDVVMAFGGFYHIADPPFVLTQIRRLCKTRLLTQTSAIINSSKPIGRFRIRADQTHRGLTSIRGGKGRWSLSPSCFDEMLVHARFNPVERARPPWYRRRRFRWYAVMADAV